MLGKTRVIHNGFEVYLCVPSSGIRGDPVRESGKTSGAFEAQSAIDSKRNVPELIST